MVLTGTATSLGVLQACAAAPVAGPTAQPTTQAATTEPARAPGPTQTFIYGIGADPTNLDPHVTVDGHAVATMHRAYDRLVRLKAGLPQPGRPLEVEPDLAESWQVSPDSLRYTFKLRDGLKFADGSPLDANAVKWSFDRLMAIKKNAQSNLRQLKTTEAPDARTVVMTLSAPYAYFLPTLGTYLAAVVNAKVKDQEKDGDGGQAWLANNVSGSGPYVLSEWRRGEQITLEQNPNWYGKQPSIRRVILKIIPEAANMRLQVEKGDIDFVATVAADAVSLQTKPGVRIEEAPSMLLLLAYLNVTKPPLNDPKVRRAMQHAINYDELIKVLLQGRGRRLRGPLALGMEGHDESLKGYDYDPAKAKALLAEAGFPNGFDLTLTYASQGAPYADELATTSQADLARVGIRVKVEKVAEPTRRERIDKNDFVWSIGGWSPPLPIPPWTMERWYLTELRGIASNRAWYTNPQVDELVKKAPTLLDDRQRIQAYQEAQRIVVEDAPYILFFQANQLFAVRDNVRGFEVKPGGSQFLDYERLSKT